MGSTPTSMHSVLVQRFSTGGTRTTGGTPDVAKWCAKNKEININYLEII